MWVSIESPFISIVIDLFSSIFSNLPFPCHALICYGCHFLVLMVEVVMRSAIKQSLLVHCFVWGQVCWDICTWTCRGWSRFLYSLLMLLFDPSITSWMLTYVSLILWNLPLCYVTQLALLSCILAKLQLASSCSKPCHYFTIWDACSWVKVMMLS